MKPRERIDPCELACRSEMTVLITGSTGTGKSTLARKIHERGCRSGGPFVTINLATLHEGTIESALFGHEKGAFTGADRVRIGQLELADGGTVFLDEIGELPVRLQARLLDFLQNRTVVRVGGNRARVLSVRIIAATHRNLGEWVKAGLFREDLFHRLRMIEVHLLSLMDRREQFSDLVHGCLEDLSRARGRTIERISPDTAEYLEHHHWPGNFRELRAVLEYAIEASEGTELRCEHLPHWFIGRVPKECGPALGEAGQLGRMELDLSARYYEAVYTFEKEYLKRALARYRGRVNLTARKIGLSKTTLIRRMRTYDLLRAADPEFSDGI